MSELIRFIKKDLRRINKEEKAIKNRVRNRDLVAYLISRRQILKEILAIYQNEKP